jgi:hypothetical protein
MEFPADRNLRCHIRKRRSCSYATAVLDETVDICADNVASNFEEKYALSVKFESKKIGVRMKTE